MRSRGSPFFSQWYEGLGFALALHSHTSVSSIVFWTSWGFSISCGGAARTQIIYCKWTLSHYKNAWVRPESSSFQKKKINEPTKQAISPLKKHPMAQILSPLPINLKLTPTLKIYTNNRIKLLLKKKSIVKASD